MNGPVCPVYGFGLVIIIMALTPLKDNLLLLFVGSVVITSSLEFVTGWALEKIFHTRWWDYTNNKFNLCGYICLGFSIIWGLAAYKCGTQDKNARSGSSEWAENSDIIARQLSFVRPLNAYCGFALFSYSYMFGKINENAKKEMQNLENML